ncbi:hypothetical protein V495_03616 [Pseudogymnoascus sp. VKM F-4514 (FW-929)]|nr:hypothetical protein V495_03616 [Pseudogymnoascus sp. VKM F-4514 (FW-929)]KFY66450.1 hypothetical protein V497_00906 [Pseudogymnoascus sp. VKM F-4516 (FW-969)]
MEVMNLPRAGNTSNVNPQLICELCNKLYQRRDLLMRHRRRCKGPIKSVTRRKACDACFQAKVKCCYTKPICTRCSKRETPCIYATSLEQQGDHADSRPSSRNLNSPQIDFADLNGQFDIPAWDFLNLSPSMGGFDMTMAELSNPHIDARFRRGATQPFAVDEIIDFTSIPSSGMPEVTPMVSSSNDSASSIASRPSTSAPYSLVRILSDYPSLLTKGSFSTPILHTSMYARYSNVIPDMTYLPQTLMAISCGSGLNNPDTNRFFRRAMDAAQQRLIKNFPAPSCMQQWDFLHAMLIYESLGLKESIRDISESISWNHDAKAQGLNSPFLIKMTRVYSRPYPQILNPDTSVFTDPSSVPCKSATSPWARWRVTETARRTTFFANILNYYSNHDLKTGNLSPYYESLDDELILNMPLPCSQAVWVARNEEEFDLAIKNQKASAIDTARLNGLGCDALSSKTLKNILARFSKEFLQAEIGTSASFADSDELRRLIILCACDQFA